MYSQATQAEGAADAATSLDRWLGSNVSFPIICTECCVTADRFEKLRQRNGSRAHRQLMCWKKVGTIECRVARSYRGVDNVSVVGLPPFGYVVADGQPIRATAGGCFEHKGYIHNFRIEGLIGPEFTITCNKISLCHCCQIKFAELPKANNLVNEYKDRVYVDRFIRQTFGQFITLADLDTMCRQTLIDSGLHELTEFLWLCSQSNPQVSDMLIEYNLHE